MRFCRSGRSFLNGLAFITSFALCGVTNAKASQLPKFSQFPAREYSRGPTGRVLSDPHAYSYRTRLREGAQQGANFAGHYRVVTWGCGTDCGTGAIIDAFTGHVVFLPSVNSYQMEHEMDPDFNSIVFRLDSRLIVFAGQLNDQGEKATFFMDFDGKTFRQVYQVIDKGAAEQPLAVEGPSSPKVQAPSGPVNTSDTSECRSKKRATLPPHPTPNDIRDVWITCARELNAKQAEYERAERAREQEEFAAQQKRVQEEFAVEQERKAAAREQAARELEQQREALAQENAIKQKQSYERTKIDYSNGYKRISISDFLLDGKRLAEEQQKIAVQGTYIHEPKNEWLYPDDLRADKRDDSNGIPFIKDDSPRNFRLFLTTAWNYSIGDYGIPHLVILGRASICERKTLVGTENPPCVIVDDGWIILNNGVHGLND